LFADRLLEFQQVGWKSRRRTGLDEKHHVVVDPADFNGTDRS
jgi:hypothetical protein